MEKLEFSGGAVRKGRLYVERPIDGIFHKKIKEVRGVYNIVAPRQTGKTSLWKKTKRDLESSKLKLIEVDFWSSVGGSSSRIKTTDDEKWFKALLVKLTRALKLDVTEMNLWSEKFRESSFTELVEVFFSDFVRKKVPGTLIFCFDEIDLVQEYSYFTDHFFTAIRALGQKCDELDMSFVFIGINKPSDLLQFAKRSLLNIGETIRLEDFEISNKNIGIFSQFINAKTSDTRYKISQRLLQEVGGQPALANKVFHAAQERGISTIKETESLIEKLIGEARNYEFADSYFQNASDVIAAQDGHLSHRLIEFYQEVLLEPTGTTRGGTAELSTALFRTGLVKRVSGLFVVKSSFHKAVCDMEWANEQLRYVGNTGRRSYVTDNSNKPPVCIINAGGMISMEMNDDGKVGEPDNLNAFLRQFPQIHNIAQIDSVPLDSKDSSNFSPADWKRIAKAIHDKRADGYKGFVVAHGTDTLPHTASAVAFALGEGLPFPVVFVGSQTAPYVTHGDAGINLIRAVSVAIQDDLPEVVALVGDTIHRAVRVEKKDDFRFDGMHSPTSESLGIISDDVYLNKRRVRKALPSTMTSFNFRNKFESNVFKIPVYPGLNPEHLNVLLDKNIEGFIIESLGIGVVPSEGAGNLIPFISKATRKNIPVLITSHLPVQPEMASKYIPAEAPIKAGAIIALNMSPPAAVTKFMWVLAQVKMQIKNHDMQGKTKMTAVKDWMEHNLIGELDILSIQNHERKVKNERR